jgi:hypothetical protein
LGSLKQLQECALPLVGLLELYLHLLVDLLQTLIVLIECVELIDQLLIVIKTQELLHLLYLCDFCLLGNDLLLHLFHHTFIAS